MTPYHSAYCASVNVTSSGSLSIRSFSEKSWFATILSRTLTTHAAEIFSSISITRTSQLKVVHHIEGSEAPNADQRISESANQRISESANHT
jgi:hypothetical protein